MTSYTYSDQVPSPCTQIILSSTHVHVHNAFNTSTCNINNTLKQPNIATQPKPSGGPFNYINVYFSVVELLF